MKYRIMAAALLMSPSSAWGQLFVRRPLLLAEPSAERVANPTWHHCGGQVEALRCGEIEAFLPAATAYVASITAVPLKSGPRTLVWDPAVWCASALRPTRTRACAAGNSGRILWQIAGHVRQGQSVLPGLYQGAAILMLEAGDDAWSVRVPVSLEVLDKQPSCMLSGGGHLDFGRAEGMRATTITLDPMQASRSWPGPNESPMAYAFAHMTVRSPAANLTVNVHAPRELSAAGASVSFTSLLAYRTDDSGPWALLMKGSGSRTIAIPANRNLQFRLGGTVITTQASPESRYTGAVTVSFHCGPGG